MTDADQLSRLLAAERAEAPSAADAARGWRELQQALQVHAPALAIGHGPLQLGLSVGTKSFLGSSLLAFTLTTAGLGVHALVTRPPEPSPSATGPVPPRPAERISPQPPLPVRSTSEPLAPSSPPAASLRPPSTLPHELRLIKSAKQELDAGRWHLAEVWLDEHARRYPNGVLRREREELRERLAAPRRPAGANPK